jgi:hypothetical protein
LKLFWKITPEPSFRQATDLRIDPTQKIRNAASETRNKHQINKTMKKRLTNVNPLKLGITLAMIYGIMSLIIAVPIFLIAMLAGAASAHSGTQALPAIFSGVFVIFLPVIYAVLVFIGGVIAAFIYNMVAKWTGGIEFITEEAS